MKEFKVKDEFRSNELSLKPGGETVIVRKKGPGDKAIICIYDKIKNPKAYMKSAWSNPAVLDVWVDSDAPIFTRECGLEVYNLIKTLSNDADLGAAVRKLYYEYKR